MGQKAKPFETGDRVAHSSKIAYQHGGRSVATWDAIKGQDADAFKGTVVGAANEQGTHWTVEVDKGAEGMQYAGETRDFTADSLVKIED